MSAQQITESLIEPAICPSAYPTKRGARARALAQPGLPVATTGLGRDAWLGISRLLRNRRTAELSLPRAPLTHEQGVEGGGLGCRP